MTVELSEKIERKKYPPTGNQKLSQLPEIEKKALIIDALEAKGFRPTDAAALLNINRSYVAGIRAKKDKSTTGLLAPFKALAKKRAKDILTGKAIENTEKAKTGDVIKIIEMVRDEVAPKINFNKNMSLRINADLGPGDRDKYLQALKIAQTLGSAEELPENTNNPVLISKKD